MTRDNFCKKVVDIIEEVSNSKNSKLDTLLHEPYFSDNKALDYLQDCINNGWVSTSGTWVTKFEYKIKELINSRYAIAVSNGTVGLRLSLKLVGVENGDEVIVPPISFIATANAVSHANAFPHFVDIESSSLGICPNNLSQHLENIAERKEGKVLNKITGRKISAIVVVHVFGLPSRIDEIVKIANNWGLPVVEDAAEALGSKIKEKYCGTFGAVGVFSFNGNKIITTGGGGIIATDNEYIAKQAKHLSTTAKLLDENGFIYHDQIGWNDRLPNINAAIGYAQLEVFNKRIRLKRLLANNYIKAFDSVLNAKIIKEREEGFFSNYWLVTLSLCPELKDLLKVRNQIISIANERGIKLRPCWQLMHQTVMYKDCFKSDLSNAELLCKTIISLPSSPQILIK